MRPTILHVEDDTALAEIVQLTFEGFGFRGTTLHAETVAEADATLDGMARHGYPIDLIISDMSLPDGTGLDVVRHARRNPGSERTPILILSGDSDPRKVGCAYALGANSYVTKMPRGRSLGDVVKSLYDHWLRDAQLPAAPELDRTNRFLACAIKLRERHAAFYMQMAEHFSDRPSEAAFWLNRSLGESNLANLITFLQRQFAGNALPAELLDEVEQAQTDARRALDAIERTIETQPFTTHDEAYRQVLGLVSHVKVQPYVRSLGYLFPVRPVATSALVDFIAVTLDEVATWIETHVTHEELRCGAARLHTDAASLRSLELAPTAVPSRS